MMRIPIHKEESPADRAARLTAQATVWMAGFTLIIVLVNVGTLWVLKKQLGEMHDGGVDTHNLAKAAQDQSAWTQRLADNMKTQADHTKELADEALIQAKAAERSAIAARSAADTAGENLRPWIKISEFGFSPDTVAKFGNNQNGSISSSFGVKLKIMNVGHSPARDIVISPSAFTARVAPPSYDQLDREAHRVCWGTPTIDMMGPPYSTFMFPSESQEVDLATVGDPNDKPGKAIQGTEIFVVLCVRYHGVGINTFHTVMIRELWLTHDAQGRDFHAPIRMEVDMDVKDLSLEPTTPWNGDFAD